MDDLTILHKCAAAMGYVITQTDPDLWRLRHENGDILNIGSGATILRKYDPLHDDAQCFQLVKKFQLCITIMENNTWMVEHVAKGRFDCTQFDKELNRAICLVVANLP